MTVYNCLKSTIFKKGTLTCNTNYLEHVKNQVSVSLCLSPSLSDSLSVSVSLCIYLSVVVKISFKFFGVTDEFSYMVERISIRIFNLAWIGRIGRWVGKIYIMMLKNEFKHKITK